MHTHTLYSKKREKVLLLSSFVHFWKNVPSFQIVFLSPFLKMFFIGSVWPCWQPEEVRVCAGYSQGLLWVEDEVLFAEKGLVGRHAGGRERQTHQSGPLHPGEDRGHPGHWLVTCCKFLFEVHHVAIYLRDMQTRKIDNCILKNLLS